MTNLCQKTNSLCVLLSEPRNSEAPKLLECPRNGPWALGGQRCGRAEIGGKATLQKLSLCSAAKSVLYLFCSPRGATMGFRFVMESTDPCSRIWCGVDRYRMDCNSWQKAEGLMTSLGTNPIDGARDTSSFTWRWGEGGVRLALRISAGVHRLTKRKTQLPTNEDGERECI